MNDLSKMNDLPDVHAFNVAGGYASAIYFINEWLEKTSFTEQGWSIILRGQSHRETRGEETFAKGTVLETYQYRLPVGCTVQLVIQTNAYRCNRAVQDESILIAQVVGISIICGDLIFNPLVAAKLPVEVQDMHHSVILFLTDLSVQLEIDSMREANSA
jgi:hypothetical protein